MAGVSAGKSAGRRTAGKRRRRGGPATVRRQGLAIQRPTYPANHRWRRIASAAWAVKSSPNWAICQPTPPFRMPRTEAGRPEKTRTTLGLMAFAAIREGRSVRVALASRRPRPPPAGRRGREKPEFPTTEIEAATILSAVKSKGEAAITALKPMAARAVWLRQPRRIPGRRPCLAGDRATTPNRAPSDCRVRAPG